MEEYLKKWNWKMDYCKNNLLTPGFPEHWDEAEKKYNENIRCYCCDKRLESHGIYCPYCGTDNGLDLKQ